MLSVVVHDAFFILLMFEKPIVTLNNLCNGII